MGKKMKFGYIKPGKDVVDCRDCAKAEKCGASKITAVLIGEKRCDDWKYQKIEIETKILHSENALKGLVTK